MSKKQGTVKLSKALSYILIVLILAAVCGFIAYFTNGFTSDFKTFYVECNSDKVMTSGGGYLIAPSELMKVDVKYTFSSVCAEQNGYYVKVVPNVTEDNNFDFCIDDDVYAFGSETDLTKGFEIVYDSTSFTIAPKGKMEDVLSAVYPESIIIIDKTKLDYGADLFKLVISSYNGEASVSITFKISDCMITGITLDKEEIVF